MAVDKRAARLGILALVGVILFSLIGVRLWFLQTVRADELQERTTAAKTRTVPLLPERGRIFDVDGRILAGNKRILTVGVDWQLLRKRTDREEIFRRLSGWVGVPIEEMQARYDAKIDSPFLPMPVARDVSEEIALALLERIEDFPGVSVLKEWERVYPYAPHAAHVVGYMGAITEEQKDEYLAQDYVLSERVGQFGVELSMESVLHGKWGKRVYEVDAAERPVRLIEEVPPIDGFDVQLTIDLDVPAVRRTGARDDARGASRRSWRRTPRCSSPTVSGRRWIRQLPDEVPYKAPAGSVIVMDYTTGQVQALASYPTFDNRWFEAGLSSEKFKQIFPDTEDPDLSILVNRAVQGRYNMGSTFKPFTAYAALNTGLISSVELFNDVGEYRMHSVNQDRCDAGLVRCVYKNAICTGTQRPCRYGPVNVTDALAVSSDAFFYRIGEDIMVRNDMRAGAAGAGRAVRVRRRHRDRSAVRVRRHGARQGAQAPVRRARHHQRGRGPRLLRRRQRPAGDRAGPAVGDPAAARGRLRDDRQPGLRVQAPDREGDLEPGRARRRAGRGRLLPRHDPRGRSTIRS